MNLAIVVATKLVSKELRVKTVKSSKTRNKVYGLLVGQKFFSEINIFILLLLFVYLTAIAFANASSQTPDLIVRIIDQQ